MIFGENPRAVQIIVEENHVFVLNEEALEQILLNPKIADKQVKKELNIRICGLVPTEWCLSKSNLCSQHKKELD